MLKERSTYEIMRPEDVGVPRTDLVLGKHSGRHALREALRELGFEVDGAALNAAFDRFKEIADKKQVTALDLEAIVSDEIHQLPVAYELDFYEVEASSKRAPLATVGIKLESGEILRGSFTGDGAVDAFFSAINAATGHHATLKEYHVKAVTGGQDALGEVAVSLELNGVSASGQGVSTDVLEASGRAYLRALSNAISGADTDGKTGATDQNTVQA
jgi:2-isopropylmalate synthase